MSDGPPRFGHDRAQGAPRPGDPIRAYFVVDRVPEGEAPSWVREAWVGLPLPLRYERAIEAPDPLEGKGVITRTPVRIDDAVRVLLPDAIRVLARARRVPAAEYWIDVWKRGRAFALAFRAGEGRLVTAEMARRVFPDFDEG